MTNTSILRNMKLMVPLIFLMAGPVAWARAQDSDADSTAEDPTVELQQLGQRLAGQLPEGLPLNTSQLPDEERARQLLREKCERLAPPGQYERIEAAREELQTCVMGLVNVTELQVEIEGAKPTGELDVVFKKYCRKSPVLTQCINNFTATLEPCMEERERESKRIVQNITEALLGFLCFKEGDRIALFIAEGGPECIQSRQDDVHRCVNSTIGQYMPAVGDGPLSSLPLFVLDERECQSLHQLQHCVVNSLEKCSEPTPANIIESLFQFVFKMTPCEHTAERMAGQSDSAAHSALATGAAALALLLTLL